MYINVDNVPSDRSVSVWLEKGFVLREVESASTVLTV